MGCNTRTFQVWGWRRRKEHANDIVRRMRLIWKWFPFNFPGTLSFFFHEIFTLAFSLFLAFQNHHHQHHCYVLLFALLSLSLSSFQFKWIVAILRKWTHRDIMFHWKVFHLAFFFLFFFSSCRLNIQKEECTIHIFLIHIEFSGKKNYFVEIVFVLN